jgi:hypothetical protein
MSTNSQNSDNQEIDLAQVSKKIGDFFEGIANQFFKFILFCKRNIIWLVLLIFLGFGLGYFLDSSSKLYTHKIVVQPNFGSVDYLYTQVELLKSKIEDKDTLFLKNEVGIKNPKKLKKIEINPINDVYKFVDDQNKNFELIKLMAEDGDIKKVVNDMVTSKNYQHHQMNFVTVDNINYDELVGPILKFLNNSEFYNQIKKEYVNNLNVKIAENDSIISQINHILNAFASKTNGSNSNDKLVYYNENSQLDDIIKTKEATVKEQGQNRIALIASNEVIKKNNEVLNIKNSESINGKLKLVFPLIFIAIFIILSAFKRFYKRQMAKINP